MTDEIPTNTETEEMYDICSIEEFYAFVQKFGGEIVAIDNGDGTFTYTIEAKKDKE